MESNIKLEGYTIAKYGDSVLSDDGSVEIWVAGCDTIEEVREYVPHYPECHQNGPYFVLEGKQTEDEFYGFGDVTEEDWADMGDSSPSRNGFHNGRYWKDGECFEDYEDMIYNRGEY